MADENLDAPIVASPNLDDLKKELESLEYEIQQWENTLAGGQAISRLVNEWIAPLRLRAQKVKNDLTAAVAAGEING